MTTRRQRNAKSSPIEALLGSDKELLQGLLKETLQDVLELEMTDVLAGGPGERTAERLGYRAGYDMRGLVTRIGKFRGPDLGPHGLLERVCRKT